MLNLRLRLATASATAGAVAVSLLLLDLALPVPLPAWHDPRPEPKTELIRVLDPDSAVALADTWLCAELTIAEDPKSASAVAWVVVNRASLSGASVLEVVAAPRQFGTLKESGWVASWPKPSSWRRAHHGLIQVAATLCQGALERRRKDPTRGATHFHRVGSWTPPWAPEPEAWVLIGDHAYYKPRPALELE